MSVDRTTLKAAAVALLDSLATEHPLGHQESKARRYTLQAPGGTPLEIMFEQDEDSSANLWAHATAAGALVGRGKSSLPRISGPRPARTVRSMVATAASGPCPNSATPT